jgi:alanyl-tRNA synthetase
MGQDEAIEAGAMALFGEKYGDEVRVVTMGFAEGDEQAISKEQTSPYSVELCGGTHVGRTGDIGLVKIISESAVAAGVRRIEALTGQRARSYLGEQEERLKESAELLKIKPLDVPERLRLLLEERKNLEKALTDAKRKLAMGGGTGSASGDNIRQIGDVKYMARQIKGIPPRDLRGLVDDGKKQIGSGIIAIVTVTDEGKAGLSVGVTKDLTGKYNAVDLVKTGSVQLGGKGGGGRPDMAQAGGPDGSKAQDALAAIEKQIGQQPGGKS